MFIHPYSRVRLLTTANPTDSQQFGTVQPENLADSTRVRVKWDDGVISDHKIIDLVILRDNSKIPGLQ